MDFETKYTKEQEEFRIVVREWMEENAPLDLSVPVDGRPLDADSQELVRKFRRKLGAKGWIAPSWPRHMGGAGLSPDMEVILQQEFRRMKLPPIGDNRRHINMILVWGTEEQKRRWVIPALRGELLTWQNFGEPGAGADIAGINTRAVPQGDNYLINGSKAMITGRFDPDYLLTLAVTDLDRPRHYNLGVFMVDARLPGVTIGGPTLLVGSERNIYLDNVLVPGDCLVGGLYQGWEICQTILQQERGEVSFRITESGTIDSIQEYLREERSSNNSNN